MFQWLRRLVRPRYESPRRRTVSSDNPTAVADQRLVFSGCAFYGENAVPPQDLLRTNYPDGADGAQIYRSGDSIFANVAAAAHNSSYGIAQSTNLYESFDVADPQLVPVTYNGLQVLARHIETMRMVGDSRTEIIITGFIAQPATPAQEEPARQSRGIRIRDSSSAAETV